MTVVRPKHNYPPWSPDEDAFLLELVKNGWRNPQIAAYFERTQGAVEARSYLLRKGVPMKMCTKPAKGRNDYLPGESYETRVPEGDPLLARLQFYHGEDVPRDVAVASSRTPVRLQPPPPAVARSSSDWD